MPIHRVKRAIIIYRKRLYILFALLCVTTLAYVAYFRYFGNLPQPTIYLFTEMPHPTPSDRIIVFSPHQDDESLGVGAYMSAARRIGAEVLVVYATDGDARHLKDRRHAEALNAVKILGVSQDHVVFYNYPDRNLSAHKTELDQSLKDTINSFKPTISFVTDPVDIHPDHAVLGSEVEYIIETTSIHPTLYTYLIHYREYPRPQQFRPHQFLLPPINLLAQDRQWLRFSVSGPDFDAKNEAILQYKSQLRTPFLHSLMLSFVRQNEIFCKFSS